MPKAEATIYSVSDYLDHINGLLALDDRRVQIQGEISSFQPHPTGIYTTLKDKDGTSILNCYIPPRVYTALGIRLEDGMEVRVRGYVNIYKPKGRLSLVITDLELAGEGTMKKAYELLKRQLDEQGLFARKRPLPSLIQRVGVITSGTGAVIGDFRKNLENLGFQVFLYDVRVEGKQAVDDIVSAFQWFRRDKLDIDVLVLMRGGGSFEDLQAFNNELIARAIFASLVPTICSIGHDRDVPIAQLVADATTSTPTAAAVLINSSWTPLKLAIPKFQHDIIDSYQYALADAQQRIQTLSREVLSGFEQALATSTTKIAEYDRYLIVANPERLLRLGYSIVYDKKGTIMKQASQLKVGETIKTRFVDGEAISKVTDIKKY